VLPGGVPGVRELARFSIDYEDLEGRHRRSGPHILRVELVDTEYPVAGISNGLVLQSGTMLRFAQSLRMIGELYYSCKEQIEEINRRRDELWRRSSDTPYDELTSPELRALEEDVGAKMRRAVDITVAMKKEVANTRLRLDNEGFDDEIEILDRYLEILGAELEWEQPRLAAAKSDLEIPPPVSKRLLQDHLANLFREMTLELAQRQGGVVAVSGFANRSGKPSALVDLLNETAMVAFGRIDTMTLVERDKLNVLLEEQELALSDLMDTENAIEFGRFLAANFIVTGSVIEMTNTVVVFGRVIDVTTGEVESVAQVILPKDPDLARLLSEEG
jgi:TolB-like protein